MSIQKRGNEYNLSEEMSIMREEMSMPYMLRLNEKASTNEGILISGSGWRKREKMSSISQWGLTTSSNVLT